MVSISLANNLAGDFAEDLVGDSLSVISSLIRFDEAGETDNDPARLRGLLGVTGSLMLFASGRPVPDFTPRCLKYRVLPGVTLCGFVDGNVTTQWQLSAFHE